MYLLEDVNSFHLIMVGIGLICVMRLLSPLTSNIERFFLMIILGALIYFSYDRQLLYGLSILKTQKSAEALTNSLVNMEEFKSLDAKPFKMILEADKKLLSAVGKLDQFKKYDVALIPQIVNDMILFYKVYAELLIETKPNDRKLTNILQNLYELRFAILKHLHMLYVSIPVGKYADVFTYIVKIIQSSTYKSLNILKNKYEISDYEPPLPNGMFTSSFEMY